MNAGSHSSNKGVQVFARVSKEIHDRIVQQQKEAKRLTGIEPSVAEVVKMLIERGLANGKKNR
jgi:hypothetical protein